MIIGFIIADTMDSWLLFIAVINSIRDIMPELIPDERIQFGLYTAEATIPQDNPLIIRQKNVIDSTKSIGFLNLREIADKIIVRIKITANPVIIPNIMEVIMLL